MWKRQPDQQPRLITAVPGLVRGAALDACGDRQVSTQREEMGTGHRGHRRGTGRRGALSRQTSHQRRRPRCSPCAPPPPPHRARHGLSVTTPYESTSTRSRLTARSGRTACGAVGSTRSCGRKAPSSTCRHDVVQLGEKTSVKDAIDPKIAPEWVQRDVTEVACMSGSNRSPRTQRRRPATTRRGRDPVGEEKLAAG